MLRRSTVNRNRIRKKIWVRQIFQERDTKGEFHMMVKDLRLFDKEYFFRNFRMDPATFELLLSWVAPHIQKSSKRRPTATRWSSSRVTGLEAVVKMLLVFDTSV